jgi:hypothetical protein
MLTAPAITKPRIMREPIACTVMASLAQLCSESTVRKIRAKTGGQLESSGDQMPPARLCEQSACHDPEDTRNDLPFGASGTPNPARSVARADQAVVARAAILARLERLVDPGGLLTPEERAALVRSAGHRLGADLNAARTRKRRPVTY